MAVTKVRASNAVKASALPVTEQSQLLVFIHELPNDPSSILAGEVLGDADSDEIIVSTLQKAMQKMSATLGAQPMDMEEMKQVMEVNNKRVLEGIEAANLKLVKTVDDRVRAGTQAEMALHLARLAHTVTPVGTVGARLCESTPKLLDVFKQRGLPLPKRLSSAWIKKWKAANEEEDLQGLAFEAVTLLAKALKRTDFYVLDTHKQDFYKNPWGKIDIAISQTTQAYWHSLIMPIELKVLMDPTNLHSVVGQLKERESQQMQNTEVQRDKMLGIAWGRDSISMWRFSGVDGTASATTGLMSFDWDSSNIGYQYLVGTLDMSLSELGYDGGVLPTDCTITDLKSGEKISLCGWTKVAGSVAIKRCIFTATASGGPFKAASQLVVVKAGLEPQIIAEYTRLDNRQNEEVLPRSLGCGPLSTAYQGLTHAYLSSPLGRHLGPEDSPKVILNVIADLADALRRLHAGVGGRTSLLHKDISPSNFVVHRCPASGCYKVLLLDLHSAETLSEGGAEEGQHSPVVSKAPYTSLRTSQQDELPAKPDLADDLESVFFSGLDITSFGHALKWSKLPAPFIFSLKFSTVYHSGTWAKAISYCQPLVRGAFTSLKEAIFKSSYEEYLRSPVEAEEFIAIVRAAANQLAA